MEMILDILFRRLLKKGLMPYEIPRLIKDVLIIVNNGGAFTVAAVNRKLDCLGWKGHIMDEYIFELILFFLECEGTYHVEKYN